MFLTFHNFFAFAFKKLSQLPKIKMSFKCMCKIIIHAKKETFNLGYQLQGTQNGNN